ncbi:hypothetical protein SISSUDRAFT_977592 [Sistotremastrum suecicum HHB10207 ss-3]|uniref:L-Fucosyltransferase n=1 Tax=Sistotremastrum suecicum HHB10207 ss-3 TaxID=1314776 RepID=A0A166ILQ7_9AGAM|nr:hypothetical protein SISSUDRAFT_977592 [Sistotremastrum suecicum HHB10207 ss-3]
MFPLEPLQYAAECWKMHQKPAPHPPYWEAGEHGVMDVAHDTSNPNVCSSTITYQLDGYVGLFADLALIAQVAALARERNRTLLIDDRYWNRGRWQDHFMSVRHTQPGPEPGCTPPPPEELVACPRLAKHWVVNSRTAKFHFSHGFDDQYHDAYSHGIDRLHPIFDMALTSLESTIIPNKFNSDLIRMARNEIGKPSYLAVHIRRGDRKPVSWKYRDGFVPLLDYLHGVEKAWQKINATSANKAIWLASDSVEAQRQFIDLLPAGVDTFGLSISSNPGLRSLQPSSAYRQVDWPSKAPSDRIQETRGVIVDFALLSGAWMPAAELGVWPEAVVCTISSNLCTLSAVPFGWELAFEKKLWVEIDNAGSIAPIWNAFELF